MSGPDPRERPGWGAERLAERRRRYRVGLAAEWLAVLLLTCKGYRILARRHRTPVGEIDIVARRGTTIAFVEVKRRDSEEAAIAAFTPRQARRLVRAAEHYLAGRPRLSHLAPRFDLVTARPGRLPSHRAGFIGAFDRSGLDGV
ncbi:MAG: YraN family protein [Rhizobiales bacterium]|nr:YraN family protein [Hyphomicrobiales bacterium]